MADTDSLSEPAEAARPRSRGRPRTRFADRTEQVKQNMRLYRARRSAEQKALSRALEGLLVAVERGDVQGTFAAAAGVAGIWKASAWRQSRQPGEHMASTEIDNVIKNNTEPAP